LSLGVCRDEYLTGTLSLYQPVASREQLRSREAAFKGEEDESDMGETPQKWERLASEGDIRRNVFIGKN
jgi:hypothetical protein